MPHDIEKLKREKPEMFDEQDVPNKSNPVYRKQIESIRPQWLKDLVAEQPQEGSAD